MAVNYKNIILDFQSLIYNNIGTILSGGQASQIDFNEGIVYDPQGVAEWIAPSVTFTTTLQEEITGDDAGVYVRGLLTVNIFKTLESGGNNTKGLDIATNINTLLGKYQGTNNATIETEIGEIIYNGLDEILKDTWLTSVQIRFSGHAT